MFGIQVTRHGGPEVLEGVDLDDLEPGPRDLVVDLAAAGLNYLDVYQRSGLYPMTLPFTPGSEGAGVVCAVGSDVTGFSVGDRVAWSSVLGSYAQQVRVPEAAAVAVPEGVGLDVAAAVMLQGMTAHYLALDTYPLNEGDRCLIHAGAGGVGLLLIQIAKRRGVEVFTTVGSSDKAKLAADAGADHVIIYEDTDFGAAVEGIAGPSPAERGVRRRRQGRVRAEHGAAAPPRNDGHVRQRVGPGRPGDPAGAHPRRLALPDASDPRRLHRDPAGAGTALW